MSGATYQGLDYQALGAVRVELEMAPCKWRLNQVRHIEAGALEVMRSG